MDQQFLSEAKAKTEMFRINVHEMKTAVLWFVGVPECTCRVARTGTLQKHLLKQEQRSDDDVLVALAGIKQVTYNRLTCR